MKIVIAPDSFKGTLSALEAATAIEEGFKKIFPNAHFTKIPMADGGEGTVQSLIDATHGHLIKATVKDPLQRNIEAYFGIMGDGTTAVIEMAAASGLTLLQTKEKNPLLTTTVGTGQLIKAALNKGVKKIIIGIGGSATIDGGAGMAKALGILLKDSTGDIIEEGGEALKSLASIDISNADPRIARTEFLIACDVTNPLIGPTGAAAIYGPQKGATPKMITILEEALTNLAQIIKKDLHYEIKDLPGAGAAGGLGGGLIAFCHAKLKPGVDIVIEASKLESAIKSADLVITGEGQLDYQTSFGKTPSGVAKIAKKHNKPVIAIAGCLGERVHEVLNCGISAYFATLPNNMPMAEIKISASVLLRKSSEQIARTIALGKNL